MTSRILTLVEPLPTDHAIWDAEGDQPFLKGAGLEAGTHQNCHLRQRLAEAAQRFDATSNHVGLLIGVPQPRNGHAVT